MKQLNLIDKRCGTRNKTIEHRMSADEFGESLNFKAGIKAHEDGLRRASNPFTLPRTRFLWEEGWKASKNAKTKAYQAAYYRRMRDVEKNMD